MIASFEGNGNINIPNWRVTAKILGTIKTEDGKYSIPTGKISIMPSGTSGVAYPGPIPTVNEIVIPSSIALQENSEIDIVPRSRAALYNQPILQNAYYNLRLNFNLKLADGVYFGNLPSWKYFSIPIEFTAYNGSNEVIKKSQSTFFFQIGTLFGTPPQENTLSLQVNNIAKNAVLEFKNIEDYTNGVIANYPNAITVKSNTNFQLKVRSIPNSLTSPSGKTIPLSTVNMKLKKTNTTAGNEYPIKLSTNLQLLSVGNTSTTSTYNYDLEYSTSKNDTNFIKAKAETYSTTLEFEIIVQ